MSDRRPSLPALLAVALTVVASAGPARAQQPPTQQQYEDALRQLQQAQDRKNQLADENAKLADENAQLKARLADVESSLRAAEATQRVYFLRAHYAAWQTFMEQYPQLLNRFQSYLNATNTVGLTQETSAWAERPPTLFESEWPFAAAAASDATPSPTTRPGMQ